MIKRNVILALLGLLLTANAVYAYAPIWSVDTTEKAVALTFDDGPKPEYSIPVLNILDKYCIKGTFFLVGKVSKFYPDVIIRMAMTGHEIGNHTYSHVRLDTMSNPKQIEDELKLTNDILFRITGIKPKYFRPPGGRYNQFVIKTATDTGLKQINWSMTAGDYKFFSEKNSTPISSTEKIVDLVVTRVKPGSIILLHNGGANLEKALPIIIEQLRTRGYRFVTVSELLRLGKPHLQSIAE